MLAFRFSMKRLRRILGNQVLESGSFVFLRSSRACWRAEVLCWAVSEGRRQRVSAGTGVRTRLEAAWVDPADETTRMMKSRVILIDVKRFIGGCTNVPDIS